MGNDGESRKDYWTLTPDDHALVMAKSRANRLGFAILLVFFRDRGRFPRAESEVDRNRVEELTRQLNLTEPIDGALTFTGRTIERHRAEIRTLFGFREATVADADMLTEWLRDHVAAKAGCEPAPMLEQMEARCRELAIETPTTDRCDRIVHTAIHAHDERFYMNIHEGLSPAIRTRLNELLRPSKDESDGLGGEEMINTAPAAIIGLRDDPGRPSLASVQEGFAKLL